MKRTFFFPFEKVEIYNVSNGERFTTYFVKEE
jgi:aspartate 1-decarboxylase